MIQQASSDMAQTSNSTQNNTNENKKGKHWIFTDLLNQWTPFVSYTLMSISGVLDAALVPNVSIEDLKQMKVCVSVLKYL